MWLPSLKTVAAAMVALTFTAVAMTHRAAEAQPQVQLALPTDAAETSAPTPEAGSPPSPKSGLSSEPTEEPAQDSDSGQNLEARTRKKREKRTQSVAVDSELTDIAPRPIVRAVPVSKDSMILAYLPNQNVGHVDNLGLANNGGGVRALFDWPAIPPMKPPRTTVDSRSHVIREGRPPDRRPVRSMRPRSSRIGPRSPAGVNMPDIIRTVARHTFRAGRWLEAVRHHGSGTQPRPTPAAKATASSFASRAKTTTERAGPATTSSAAKAPASG